MIGIGQELSCPVESKLLGKVSLELLPFEFPEERREELKTGVTCCTSSGGNNGTISPLVITCDCYLVTVLTSDCYMYLVTALSHCS